MIQEVKKRVPYHRGKRYMKKENSNVKKILFFAMICIVVILVFIISSKRNDNMNSVDELAGTNEVENITNDINTADTEDNLIKTDEIVESNLPNSMGNYTVIGELVIDKIGVRKNILNKTDDTSLNLSVTKFYGPNVNEVGNLCITGHNYNGLLRRLNELQIDDTFYLISKEKSTKVTYKIYDKYTCDPSDLDCLDQPTDQTREVTLITCNPGGLTRLICKAKEV